MPNFACKEFLQQLYSEYHIGLLYQLKLKLLIKYNTYYVRIIMSRPPGNCDVIRKAKDYNMLPILAIRCSHLRSCISFSPTMIV